MTSQVSQLNFRNKKCNFFELENLQTANPQQMTLYITKSQVPFVSLVEQICWVGQLAELILQFGVKYIDIILTLWQHLFKKN